MSDPGVQSLDGDHVDEIRLGAQTLDRFEPVLGREALDRVRRVAEAARERLSGRAVWNVNSTAVGGGVAEMLRAILTYARGMGVDSRWLVVRGEPAFFRVTKRLHNALHGSPGDGSALDEEAHALYEETLHRVARELCARVCPRDVVLLHDPQTAGLGRHLAETGAMVIWRSHIGSEASNEEMERGWRFLERYLRWIQAYVFTRQVYVPDYCDHGKATIIQPSIDAFSPKNQEIDEATVRAILVHTGLVEGPAPAERALLFDRADGTRGRVERFADVVRLGRAPAWDTPLVVQVSRWDPLKDPIGVMHGFARLVDGHTPRDAELVLAGPNVSGVSDDPEGAATFERVVGAWRALPHGVRARVHLATLPTADVEENAAIVNALQRHAAVVVQKSLAEGFGLTVTEALWKGRPVVASAVGGIQDQIVDGESGLLLDDPRDLDVFAGALRGLLDDPERAERLGRAGRERVREHFLGLRHLVQYAELIAKLDARRAGT